MPIALAVSWSWLVARIQSPSFVFLRKAMRVPMIANDISAAKIRYAEYVVLPKRGT